MRLQKISADNGFSLIEVAVVTAILAIVGLVSLNIGTESLPRYFFRSDSDMFGASLLSLRSRAVNAIDGQDWGIYVESKKYIIFSGSVYQSHNLQNEIYELFPGVSFFTTGELSFEKESGVVDSPKTFTMKSHLSEVNFNINSEGGISW